MVSNQAGFTLIETVIAFTILAMSTVVVVNLVTQSATRVGKVNSHLTAIDVLESAVATLRGELGNRDMQPVYSGEQPGGYRWTAEVLGRADPDQREASRYLNLYRVRIDVYGEQPAPRLTLTTIVADR